MKDMILNQTRIPRDKWRYGFRSSAATGCGWIATLNAMILLGKEEEPERLIRFYHWALPLINGNCGTFIGSIWLYFVLRGYRVDFGFRRSSMDKMVRDSDVCILFYCWRSRRSVGAHYVTVTCKDGEFIGFNTYTNSTSRYLW